MHTTIENSFGTSSRRSLWTTIVLASLAFWLSSSLLLDLVIMPSLYTAGMLARPDFVPAGYSLFWVFNRIEVLCAALVLTGLWVLRRSQNSLHRKGFAPMVLSSVLLTIALLYTYVMAPSMTALSLDLTLFESVVQPVATSPEMIHLQVGYWGMEVLKLSLGGVLLGLCWSDRV